MIVSPLRSKMNKNKQYQNLSSLMPGWPHQPHSSCCN